MEIFKDIERFMLMQIIMFTNDYRWYKSTRDIANLLRTIGLVAVQDIWTIFGL